MAACYIEKVHVNRIFHMQSFDIEVCNASEGMKHLIITGPNGTGKTLLVRALVDHLEEIAKDSSLDFLKIEEYRDSLQKRMEQSEHASDESIKAKERKNLAYYKERVDKVYGKVRLSISNIADLPSAFAGKRMIIASYEDVRQSGFKNIVNPTKPDLEYNSVKVNKVGEFMKYLVDLKVQRALALGEQKIDDATLIDEWFKAFEGVLRRLFDDKGLALEFDYKTYTFHIHTGGKKFRFTELSAGYSAALDIITDLMLKMQSKEGTPLRSYEMPGIALIDEIETHLHLKMQKEILPLLTSLFPRIQFVVTTHSPFVLNSLDNAVAYDLERHETIDDLTDYSYDSLAEGYFDVDLQSSKLNRDMDRVEYLCEQDNLNPNEKDELKRLINDFENIPDSVAQDIKIRFHGVIAKRPKNFLQSL